MVNEIVLQFVPARSFIFLNRYIRTSWQQVFAKSEVEQIEYGGFILAELIADNIFDVSFHSSEKGIDSNKFGRDISNIEIPQEYAKDPQSIFYLGEWHTHLHTQDPSPQDLLFFDIYPLALLFIILKDHFVASQAPQHVLRCQYSDLRSIYKL